MFYRGKDVLFPALFSALLAGVFSFGANYHGVLLAPDSWNYWEGSVSLLQGGGYKNFNPGNFHHVLIATWPPLFSLYLAGVQWVFGISGFSLILSLVFIAIGSAFVWTYVFCSLCGEENRWARFALAGSVAALVSYFSRHLLSDSLSVLVIGVVLVCTIRLFSARSSLLLAKWHYFFLLFFSLSLSACMLTRKANMFFIPAVWVAAMFFARGAGWRRPVAFCSVLSAISFLIYFGVVSIFAEQGNSGLHVHFGAHSLETVRYLQEFFLGVENSVFLGMSGGGPLALIVSLFACAIWFAVSGGFRFDGRKIKKALASGVVLIIQIVCVFCLMHFMTWGLGRHFMFEERYVWHMTIAFAGAFGIAVTYFPVSFRGLAAFKRAVFPAVFALVCVFQVFQAGRHAVSGVLVQNMPPVLLLPQVDPAWIWRVPRHHALRRGYVYRLPTRLPDGTVIRPPFGPFWWQYGNRDADGNVIPPPDYMWIGGDRILHLFKDTPPPKR